MHTLQQIRRTPWIECDKTGVAYGNLNLGFAEKGIAGVSRDGSAQLFGKCKRLVHRPRSRFPQKRTQSTQMLFWNNLPGTIFQDF